MSNERRVSLFRNGRNQAVRIPRGFELPGDQAVLRKDGERLILAPLAPAALSALLASWSELDESIPDVDEGLLPLDDVAL